MAKSPAAILYDGSGNPVSVLSDGGVYRLQSMTKLTDGTNVVDVLDDGGIKRLRVDAKISTSTTAANLATDYLKTAGGVYQMKANGAGTPVVFYYAANATKDITLLELRIVFSAEALNWSGAGFGKSASGALTSGILFELIVNNGVTSTLTVIKTNEDFLRTYGEIPAISQGGVSDVLVTSFKSTVGILLKAGTGDRVRATVRDNLTNASLGVNSLSATFYGEKAI